MKKIFMSLAVMSFVSVASSSALAADNGFYIGVGAGANFFDSTDSQITVGNPGGYDAPDTDLAFRVYGGYQINKYVGFEVAYVDLGTQKIDFVGIDRINKMSVKGVNLSLVGSYPVTTSLDVFAKVGASYLKNTSYEYGADFLLMEGEVSAKNSDRSWEPSVGVGMKYAHSKNVGIRAEYDRMVAKAGAHTVDITNNVFSVSAQYNF
ncbi:MAG: outer membrane beta-barrel protein [Thiobacillus sp.]